MASNPQTSAGTSQAPNQEILGSTVMGERGQVVIPKEIRDRLKLTSGAQLMVMQRDDGPIMLIPVEQMRTFIDRMHERMTKFTSLTDNTV